MRMTVGFNGDLDLIPKYEGYPVDSIFTKMTQDVLGGGRPSFLLPNIDFKHLIKIIETAHRHNIKVNYLLNAVCMANNEFTRNYNNKLFSFIGKLMDIGIDAVVVATPYMVDLLKYNFPDLKISVSIFTNIESVKQAKFWEDRGASRIIISPSINRNFSLIRQIRKAVKCEIEIFANTSCLYKCPYTYTHNSSNAHASSATDKNKRFYIDYSVTNCTFNKLNNPAEIIMSRWIRPEDISYYEKLGIDVFKIADRAKSSEWMLNTVKAYAENKYEGNLIDILQFPMVVGDMKDSVISSSFKRIMLRPNKININFLKQTRRKPVKIYLDNNKLNNFLKHFEKTDCEKLICGQDCKYCNKLAEKCIHFPEKRNKELSEENIKDTIQMLVNRKAFEKNSFLDSARCWIERFIPAKQ